MVDGVFGDDEEQKRLALLPDGELMVELLKRSQNGGAQIQHLVNEFTQVRKFIPPEVMKHAI